MGGYDEVPVSKPKVAIAEGTPTQVAHPWRAVLRTLVVGVIGWLLAELVRVTGLDLTHLATDMVDSITKGLWALFTAFCQYIITRPEVEDWLVRYLPGLATGVHSEIKLRKAD